MVLVVFLFVMYIANGRDATGRVSVGHVANGRYATGHVSERYVLVHPQLQY